MSEEWTNPRSCSSQIMRYNYVHVFPVGTHLLTVKSRTSVFHNPGLETKVVNLFLEQKYVLASAADTITSHRPLVLVTV